VGRFRCLIWALPHSSGASGNSYRTGISAAASQGEPSLGDVSCLLHRQLAESANFVAFFGFRPARSCRGNRELRYPEAPIPLRQAPPLRLGSISSTRIVSFRLATLMSSAITSPHIQRSNAGERRNDCGTETGAGAFNSVQGIGRTPEPGDGTRKPTFQSSIRIVRRRARFAPARRARSPPIVRYGCLLEPLGGLGSLRCVCGTAVVALRSPRLGTLR